MSTYFGVVAKDGGGKKIFEHRALCAKVQGRDNPPVREENFRHGHPVFRERSGFIGTDNVRAAESFNGMEPPYEGVSLEHPGDGEPEGDGDNGGEPLGNCGDGEGDPRQEHIEGGLAPQNSGDCDDEADKNTAGGNVFAEGAELFLERRGLGLRAFKKPGDFAHLGAHSRFTDKKFAVAGGYNGTHIDKIIPQSGGIAAAPKDGFAHREGLAGQKGLVGGELRRNEHGAIRRDPAAGGKEHHVPGNEGGGGNLRLCTVPENRRLRRGHSLKVLKGALGSVLLTEAEHGVYENDCHNRHGIDVLPEKKGNYGAAKEN